MMSPCELNKWEKAMKNTQILAKIAVVVLVFIAVNANAAVREYWIAADEVVWDYMPSYPVNLMTGQELADEKKVFVENIPGQLIGRQYIKAIYRQYTADWQLISRTPEEQLHLGTLGPVIYAAVGDDIIVHFRNNTRYPVSVHPHGVFYDKSSEGAPYTDSAGRAVGLLLGGAQTSRSRP
jgi:hypothetical protein